MAIVLLERFPNGDEEYLCTFTPSSPLPRSSTPPLEIDPPVEFITREEFLVKYHERQRREYYDNLQKESQRFILEQVNLHLEAVMNGNIEDFCNDQIPDEVWEEMGC